MQPTDRFIPLRPTENSYDSLSAQNESRNTNLTRQQAFAQEAYRNAVMAACGHSSSNVLSFSSSATRAAHPAQQYVANEERVLKENAQYDSYSRTQPRCIKILEAPSCAPYNYATHIDVQKNQLAAALEGNIHIMNLTNMASTETPETSLEGRPTCVHWIDEQLFTATESGFYCIIPSEASRVAAAYHYAAGPIFSATSTQNSVLFTSKVSVMNADIRILHKPVPVATHSAEITALTMSANAIHLATSDETGTLAIWDMRNVAQVYRSNQGSTVTALEWNPANPGILFSSSDNKLTALSVSNPGAPVCQMEVDGPISAINVSETGSELVLSQNGSPSLLKVLQFAHAQFEYLAYSPIDKDAILDMSSSSNFTVTLSDNECIRIWDHVFTPAAPERKPFTYTMLR